MSGAMAKLEILRQMLVLKTKTSLQRSISPELFHKQVKQDPMSSQKRPLDHANNIGFS